MKKLRQDPSWVVNSNTTLLSKLVEYLHAGMRDVRIGWLLALSLVLLLVRAWPRLAKPQVWNEDGTQNLIGFLNEGIGSFLQPVNGYLIVIPKLITAASASISISYYPELSTLLAWGFIVFVLLAIARAPVYLRGGFFLVVLCMLIPTDPENFGIPLYTFWWSALLLFVLVFWRVESENFLFRSTVLVLASLSSPVCMVTLPLFWLRTYLFKKHTTEFYVALVATSAAAFQLWAMWPIAKGGQLSLAMLPLVVPAFLGNYITGSLYPAIAAPFGWAIFCFVALALFRHRGSLVIWGLCYLWAASVLMSITRVDIGAIHPVSAGPRYFFFPFILLSWLLLQILIADKNRLIRIGALSIIILSVLNAAPSLQRGHSELEWRRHISSCTHFSEYSVPIQYDGSAGGVWRLTLQGAQCIALRDKELVGTSISRRTFPYRVVYSVSNQTMLDLSSLELSSVRNNSWAGQDYSTATTGKSSIASGFKIIGSFRSSDVDKGVISLRMRRGDRILFRTDSSNSSQRLIIAGYEKIFNSKVPATSDWTILDFSNALLPAEFELELIDDGIEPGDWSAIAIRK